MRNTTRWCTISARLSKDNNSSPSALCVRTIRPRVSHNKLCFARPLGLNASVLFASVFRRPFFVCYPGIECRFHSFSSFSARRDSAELVLYFYEKCIFLTFPSQKIWKCHFFVVSLHSILKKVSPPIDLHRPSSALTSLPLPQVRKIPISYPGRDSEVTRPRPY